MYYESLFLLHLGTWGDILLGDIEGSDWSWDMMALKYDVSVISWENSFSIETIS